MLRRPIETTAQTGHVEYWYANGAFHWFAGQVPVRACLFLCKNKQSYGSGLNLPDGIMTTNG